MHGSTTYEIGSGKSARVAFELGLSLSFFIFFYFTEWLSGILGVIKANDILSVGFFCRLLGLGFGQANGHWREQRKESTIPRGTV